MGRFNVLLCSVWPQARPSLSIWINHLRRATKPFSHIWLFCCFPLQVLLFLSAFVTAIFRFCWIVGLLNQQYIHLKHLRWGTKTIDENRSDLCWVLYKYCLSTYIFDTHTRYIRWYFPLDTSVTNAAIHPCVCIHILPLSTQYQQLRQWTSTARVITLL